jgi:hypothetical protein
MENKKNETKEPVNFTAAIEKFESEIKADLEKQVRELRIKNARLIIENLILSIEAFPDMVHFLQPELKRIEEVLERQEGRNRR